MSDLLVTKSEKDILASKGFKLFRLLNFGSDSKIYLANFEEHETKQRFYLACKVYDTKKMHKKYITKFLPRELNTLLNISHSNIIQIHCIFKWRSKFYIFMRYAERGDLFDYIKYNGRVENNQTRTWFIQITTAIKYLHDMDIAHRDLKCENILLTRNFNVKVADFGFSRSSLDEKGEPALCATYCGSISYTAPEIIKGLPYLAKPTDLWSIGVILYVMCNRSMPFYEENVIKLYYAQMNGKWKFKSKYETVTPEPVKNIIKGLLDPHPSTRLNIEQVLASIWLTENSSEKESSPVTTSTTKPLYLYKNNFERSFPSRVGKSNDCLMIKDIMPLTRSDTTLVTEEEQDVSEIEDKTNIKKGCCCIII